MIITLNISLDVSKHYLPEGTEKIQWQYEYVKGYLEKALGTPICIGIALRTTERTVVAQYSNVEAVLQKLFRLAHELQQDYISYEIKDGAKVLGGALVGKCAHLRNYGIFDEEHFITEPWN